MTGFASIATANSAMKKGAYSYLRETEKEVDFEIIKPNKNTMPT
jgi:ActR/RegA family two-component response regulator